MRRWILLPIMLLLIIAAPIVAQGTSSWLDDLDGVPCPDSDFTCVTLTVPLDHFDADSDATIDVTFAVLPASGERKGMFVVATGGPGSAGLASADSYTSGFDPAIPEMFDIVFFDQRGIGQSGGLDCPDAAAAYYQADGLTDTPEHEAALIDSAQTFAEDCMAEMNTDGWLPYLGTAQAVEDLEALRQVVGDDQFWLYGESYGTQFAQTYAAAHPDHLAGLILDGVVDLTLEGTAFLEQQAQAFENVLGATLDSCNADTVCAADMGGDAQAAYSDLAAELHASPVMVDFPLSSGETTERPFTETDLVTVAAGQVYSKGDRMLFLRALAAASGGDLVPMLRLAYINLGLDSETLDVIVDPTFSSGMFYGVECNDYNYFSGTPEERAEAYIRAGDPVEEAIPRMGSIFYGDLPCVFWQTTGEAERPAPLTADGIPTFVLTANTDPATPVSNSYGVFSRLDDGYLIVQRGGPHVIFGRGDACPDVTITAFLTDDTLPAERQYVCDGSTTTPYVPLASASDLADPGDAMQAIDNAIYYLPEYYYWDGSEPTKVGCPYGGSLSFAATEDGEKFSLDHCEFIEGAVATGKGSSVYGESFTLNLTFSGAVEGHVVYTYDVAGGMFSVSGEYEAQEVAPRP